MRYMIFRKIVGFCYSESSIHMEVVLSQIQVGLGKTFEALAIIKYFEIGMNRCLVLTPAKLYDNWNSFRGDYKDSFLKKHLIIELCFIQIYLDTVECRAQDKI